MHKIKYKLTVATFLIFFLSNCTYWPTANAFLKDHLLTMLNPSAGNSLNMFAALFLIPSAIDTTPGTNVNLTLSNNHTSTWVDVSGDSISDGIDLTGDGIPNILVLDLNSDGKPDSFDTNGDGQPEYFLNVSLRGGVLRTGANGTGNPVFLVVNELNEVMGFDTDGDGVPNDTLIHEILKDKTVPVLSTNLSSGVYPSHIEITLQCNDDKAPGHVIYTLDTSNPSFSPLNGTVKHPAESKISFTANGSYTVNAFCRDLGGNISNKISRQYTIDPNLPNLQIVGQSSKGVTNNAGAISQSITRWSSTKSGNYTIRFGSNSCSDGSVLASGTASANTEYTFTRNASDYVAEGEYFYRICLITDLGRTGEISFSVHRDDTPPTVSASVGSGNYGAQPSPALSCSDVGGSGCNGIVFTLNSAGLAPDPVFDPVTGTVTTGSVYSYAAITMPNLATTSLKFQASDAAGNMSAINLQTYVIDSDLPTITVNSFSSLVKGTTNPSINWRSNKAGTYQLQIDGTDCSSGTAFTAGFPNSNVVGSVGPNTNRISMMNKSLFVEGNNTIRICFTTSFGVQGSISRLVYKDSVNPVVSIVSPTGSGPFPSGTQIILQCTDTNGSGCKNIGYYTLDDGGSVIFNALGNLTSGSSYTGPISLPDGLITFSYSANDMALNNSTYHSTTMQIGFPDSPNFAKVTGVNTSAFIEWLPTASATTYSLYYSTSPNVNATSTRIDGITNPYYHLTGLTPNTIYFFKLQAHSALGSSLLSSYESKVLTSTTPMGLNAMGGYSDISVGQPANSGFGASAKIDYTNQKLIVTSQNAGNSYQPNVIICELDGTNCVYRDISAGQASATAYAPTLEIDTRNQKLLVVAGNTGNFSRISLFRCDLDGTNCTHQDVSGGNGATYGPNILIDSIYKKLIIISTANSSNLSVSRCDLDGTNCQGTFPFILGAGGQYVREISSAIDPISQKILILARNGDNGDILNLIRCSILANNCSLIDVSAGRGASSGFSPQLNVDVKNAKLIMTARDQTTGFLGLYRCELDGSNCFYQDISSGIAIAAEKNSAKIDSVNGKLLVAARDSSTGRAHLFRSDLDGNNCTVTDVSNGNSFTGNTPSLVIDALNGRTAIVTNNAMNGMRLGLFLR